MKIRIDVTEDDIKNGRRGHGEKCPVALACQRVNVKNFSSVEFGAVSFNDGKMISHSCEVQEFVQRFDSGKEVQPFSFELELP